MELTIERSPGSIYYDNYKECCVNAKNELKKNDLFNKFLTKEHLNINMFKVRCAK
jgi:hypothetical protein